jgi:hypothetical protein
MEHLICGIDYEIMEYDGTRNSDTMEPGREHWDLSGTGERSKSHACVEALKRRAFDTRRKANESCAQYGKIDLLFICLNFLLYVFTAILIL